MSSLRIGVLGAAKIADRSTVPAMQATAGVEVAGIAARDIDRARDFGRRHGVPVFASYDEVIADDTIDAVYIPLPVGLHAEWALSALAAGKHVLCEKSLAGTYDEIRRIVEEARARNLVVVENFMCERHPQSQFIRTAISEGSLGDVHNVSLSFGFPPFPDGDLRNSAELAGGALNDAGAYCVDMAAFYLQDWPVAVTAALANGPKEVDIVGSALLEYEGGMTASIAFGFMHDYRNEARIWGTTGQIDIDRAFSIPADRTPDVRVKRNTVVERVELQAADQFALQIEYFRDLVNSAGGSDELLRRQRHGIVMEALRRSADEHRRVALGEFEDWTSIGDVR